MYNSSPYRSAIAPAAARRVNFDVLYRDPGGYRSRGFPSMKKKMKKKKHEKKRKMDDEAEFS